ncbi:hypothetical protein NGM10_10070 [Halorussus salilacus]|uniref:DUF7562 family protein n=1 Tax=Halorussus salilacus TaxID=2953750 RepID=UPI0020A16C88|nr:hypothetical protein [Halorussus salilacus]USZ67076.1 hypothetical protein NGM10_10070 [Halorussus salilacus]
MWGSRRSRGNDSVECIACGLSLSRSDAREYDKEGDRWERKGKEFEHLCKECHDDLCHQPRNELEGLLVDIEAGRLDEREFLDRYARAVEERYGPLDYER